MSKKQNITYPATGLLQRTLSKVSQNNATRLVLEVSFLLALGAVAAFLHTKLKIPMQMPGRQGLVFMALLIIGRTSSSLKPAALISSLGSVAVMLGGAFSFGDPFTPVIYLFLGLVLDFLYNLINQNKSSILIVSLIAGLCWMVIPLSRLFISMFSSYPFHSLRYGPVIPLLTHLVFGFTGGILGFSISKLINRETER